MSSSIFITTKTYNNESCFQSAFCDFFASTLTLNSSFGQHIIQLTVDPVSHKVVDPGTEQDVYWGESVRFEIKPGELIEWFRIAGARHPFHRLPSRGNWTIWTGDVRKGAPTGDWKYTIHFKVTGYPADKIDPKLAIKPPRGFNRILMFLLGTIVPLIASIFLYRKLRKAVMY